MAAFEIHMEKYRLFRKDAENKDNSSMTRINAYFEACFHLIDACAATIDMHINKHQDVRKISEEKQLFGTETAIVWNKFQELENRIRPAQSYGGRINGEQLKKAEEISAAIFKICERVIDGFRGDIGTKSTNNGFSRENRHENAEGI